MTKANLKFLTWKTETNVSQNDWSPVFSITTREDQEQAVFIKVNVGRINQAIYARDLGEVPEQEKRSAIAEVSLLLIDETMRSSSFWNDFRDGQTVSIEFGAEDYRLVADQIQEKSCRYLVHPDGHDQHCGACAATDETVIGIIDGRRIAPTSNKICQSCPVPRTHSVCSEFKHPQVFGIRTMGGWTRSLGTVLCDRGRSESESPSNCRPGGNACWNKSISLLNASQETQFSVQDLLESLDFLNALWQARINPKPLIQVSRIGQISQIIDDCDSRQDFNNRVADLWKIFDEMKIESSLTASSGRANRPSPLDFLEEVLQNRCQGDSQLISDSIEAFRFLKSLRNGDAHAAAAYKAVPRFEALGLFDHRPDFQASWKRVVSMITGAVRDLRIAIQRIDVSTPE